MRIGDREVGAGSPPLVVAELSANHNGSLGRAEEVIRAAAAAGADAVKFQTYTADTITLDSDAEGFTIARGPWAGRRLWELYDEAHTPWEWHERLFGLARELGLIAFSTPFDATALEFLEQLDPPVYKIASFEAVDLPLIERVAGAGKPLIVSTGMAGLGEITEAVAAAQAAPGLVLLHCTSGYPTPPEEANLRAIGELERRFGVPVGLSDHTPGSTVATAAVALGACLIEKHVTLDRGEGGPDAEFSLEPDELARLCQDVRTAWSALGDGSFETASSEAAQVELRRSLYVVADVEEGELFSEHNVRSIRPGHGLAPKRLPEVLGRRAAAPVTRGTPLREDLLA